MSFSKECILLVCILVSAINGDPLKFFFLGDWGGQETAPYTTPIQLQVASQMERMSSSGAQFVVTVGDNFYYHGIPTDVDDPRFKATFEDVYSEDIPFWIVAGNHDHLGNVTAQLAYAERSSRWIYPSLWWSKVVPIPSNPPSTAQFIFIDTPMWAGLKVAKRVVEPNAKMSADQIQWLQETLSNSTADWIFVSGHYPVWSVSTHGPTPTLVKQLKPLLEQYKVAAYFAGHDHNLQHIRENGSSVDYYLSGAGHTSSDRMEHQRAVPKGSLKYFWPSTPEDTEVHGGFCSVEIADQRNMKIVYHDDQGRVLYSHQKTNPRRS
jgi:tartrate-resistant acid phosphatase type 5